MYNGQLTDTIGPFQDSTTGQQLSGQLNGAFSYQATSNSPWLLQALQTAILSSVHVVLTHKLASGQCAIPTIGSSLPHFVGEIITHSDAQQFGAQITHLQLQVQMQAPAGQAGGQAGAAAGGYAGAMPPTPQQAMQNSFRQHAQEALDPSNYEMRAKVKIGGIRINANTTDGIDTDGIAKQLEDRAKSNLIWYGASCVIAGIVILGLAGFGWYVYAQAKASTDGSAPSGEAKVAEWDGTKPFSCGGSDNVVIKGVSAKLKKGTAVSAGGNCRLELSDVTIEAPTALKAAGNAVITVKGGSVTGKKAAASALANGQIKFEGTKVQGPTKALGPKAKVSGP